MVKNGKKKTPRHTPLPPNNAKIKNIFFKRGKTVINNIPKIKAPPTFKDYVINQYVRKPKSRECFNLLKHSGITTRLRGVINIYELHRFLIYRIVKQAKQTLFGNQCNLPPKHQGSPPHVFRNVIN